MIAIMLTACSLYGAGSDISSQDATTEDWPMYRADAARSGYTSNQLPAKLEISWMRTTDNPPVPAWSGRDTRMPFDLVFQPVVSKGLVFWGSSSECKVYAADAKSGAEKWSFYTGSPVRFAPAIWNDRLFVVSDEVDALVKEGLKGRKFAQGKRMFEAAHCYACHQFNGGGGVAGPDLSNLGRRFSVKDIMDSINEPSKVINAFYEATNITLKDGSFVYGQVIEKTETELKIMTNPYDTSNLTSVKLSEIESREISHVSQMPPMMTSMFNKEELLDFMAYILSQGNHKHAYFKK